MNGGSWPRWSADGKQLFFVRAGKLFAVGVDVTHGLHFDVPKALPVTVPLADAVAVVANYAITRDGKIITLANVTQATPNAVHLIANWPKVLPQ